MTQTDDIELTRAQTCDVHGAFTEKGIRFNLGAASTDLWQGCARCATEAREAAERRQQEEEAAREARAIEAHFGSACIPTRFRGVGFDSYAATTPEQERVLNVVRDYADCLPNGGACLILAGGCGTGKTHLALAAAQQHMKAGSTALYVTVLDLVRMLRDTWRKDSGDSESQVLGRLSRVGLLVIDEVGVQYGTGAEQLALTTVIDRRYREQMPMILLTNMEPAPFAEAVGERSADRLREVGRWLPFRWESYRRRA